MASIVRCHAPSHFVHVHFEIRYVDLTKNGCKFDTVSKTGTGL